MGFIHLKIKKKEKLKPKTKLARQKLKNQFYKRYTEPLQLPNTENLSLGIYQLPQETFFHFAFKEKHKKWRMDYLVMINN